MFFTLQDVKLNFNLFTYVSDSHFILSILLEIILVQKLIATFCSPIKGCVQKVFLGGFRRKVFVIFLSATVYNGIEFFLGGLKFYKITSPLRTCQQLHQP